MPKDDGPGAAAPVGGGNGNNEALLAPNVVVAPCDNELYELLQ